MTVGKFHLLSEEATAFLTAAATGTFIYITFFEILAKDLNGDTIYDFLNFLICLFGFGIFASITAVPALQA